MLNEDFSPRFSWSAQERTAKATTNKPGFCHQIWQDALGGRSDVQFTMYPGLSHLFMPVEGGQKATPATYTVAGHVAESVVNEIGSWIKRHATLPPL